MDSQYKHIHFVTFQSLINWSVAHLLNRDLGFTKRYSFVRIGDLIHRSSELVTIKDDILYTQVTLKTNGGGAVLRDKKLGKEIGTKKQYLAKEGQFIMSKIDARNGAFGIVSKELDNAIVTGDFPLFDVDTERINPTYLYLLSSTRQFVRYAQSCSRGTTNRQRIDIDAFLGLQIPLPSMEEQNAIIAAYNTYIEQAIICTSTAHGIDAEIEEYLHNILGTNIELNQNDSLLSFVHYKDISRWDPLFLLSSSNIHSKYQLVTLSTCINNFLSDENGVSLRIETQKTPTQEYRYIGMENVEKETGRVVDAPIVKGKEIKSQTIKVPTKYFIYGKLRPYLNKYWYNDSEQPEEIICSSEFFVFDIKDNINTNYFKYVLASYIVQKQIVDAMSGARMPRISEDTFRNIQIPLPPLDIQNEIVEHITLLREKQKTMIEQAKERRKQAAQQFEETIFE